MRKRERNFLERIVLQKSVESYFLVEEVRFFFYIYDLYNRTYYCWFITYFLSDRSELDIREISLELNLSESGYYRKLNDIRRLFLIIAEIRKLDELIAIILM